MLTAASKPDHTAVTGMMGLQASFRSMLAAVQESEYITELAWPLDLQNYYDTVLLRTDKVEVICKSRVVWC